MSRSEEEKEEDMDTGDERRVREKRYKMGYGIEKSREKWVKEKD